MEFVILLKPLIQSLNNIWIDTSTRLDIISFVVEEDEGGLREDIIFFF